MSFTPTGGYDRIAGVTAYTEYSCKSTDVKPTDGIMNGAWLYEIDTGNIYIFDADTLAWLLKE